ncbi:MurR/RpiR family transcriptional regulator [Oscillospiraceae bacterium DSM 107454]|uniref:MurR/RpiR family transcriptional regulator n=1 Tax=Ructibacterium gallinarum TaxID=2779355 RepID=A0A9D5M4V4_9FIRM|nr:MurR/RpiR family transcriptional regulator [Ructibacterium gallinarum]MBE5040739.1 MurR/RpiR family transcriptional regulator [Ructibacterium gallinarum]
MNKTSLNIQVLYKEMGKTEKRIADWILAHPGKIISLSIVELAEQCGCSEATIVRFSKRLGLSGYQELKISLAAESGTETVSTSITAGDSAFTIYEKVCNDIYCSLELTKKSLDQEKFSLAAQTICHSDKIVLFGLGNSASVALDASHKFMRTGLNAVAYSDNHMQVIAASHLKENDTAIAVSHSGSSKDIVDALKIAKDHGARTIAITNHGKSPLLKYTDIPLFTSSAETQYNILALNSRIAQLAIIDTLYFYVVYHGSSKTLASIRETEQSLLSKKY